MGKAKTKLKHYLQFLSRINKKSYKIKEKLLQQNLQTATIFNNTRDIYEINQKLKELQQIHYKGAQIRSKEFYLSEDEEASNIFRILEHKKQSRNISTLSKIFPQSYSNADKPFFEYYHNLWNHRKYTPSAKIYLNDIQILQNPTTYASALITLDEIACATKLLNKKASPGSDGLTSSFYILLPCLYPFLRNVFNNIYITKLLSTTQRQALVTLFPKASKPSSSISAWRPISLLNTDYKILSIIIANRLKPLLSKYISPEQQCGLPDRHLYNCHLNIKAAMEYASDTSQPLAIIQIDFQKAFDSISHTFLLDTATKIGIPHYLITWISIFLQSIYSQIIVNKNLTEKIPITNGIRQGCPLSMLLFVLGIEPLIQKFKSSSDIKGINIGSSELKLTQYADDLILFITDRKSITACINILDSYSKYSGLQINTQKTKIMANCPTLIMHFQTIFPNSIVLESTKILGINFSFLSTNILNNWKYLSNNINQLWSTYLNRQTSIYGKVKIINAIFIPRILFLARIYFPSDKYIKYLTHLICKFIWNNHPLEPIARQTLYMTPKHGGIALPSISHKIQAAYLWQVAILRNSDNTENHFWMKYAQYSLGTKILTINPTLYTNSMPHRSAPNSTWNKLLTICKTHNISSDLLSQITFKSLYYLILPQVPVPLPSLNSSTPPTSWLEVALLYPKSNIFTCKEKEIAYRTAHKGYLWGSFFQDKHINTHRILTCKLCGRGRDHPHHVFYDCRITRRIITACEHFIPSFTHNNPTTKITKALMLFSTTNLTEHNKLTVLKMASIIRQVLLSLHDDLDLQNNIASKKQINNTLWKIKCKFKSFSLNLSDNTT